MKKSKNYCYYSELREDKSGKYRDLYYCNKLAKFVHKKNKFVKVCYEHRALFDEKNIECLFRLKYPNK